MAKKSKLAKGRLDKFYHIAKEQGYRSRASYKLIQLNKKYQFLTNANAVVDLCAAPGGWLQVVEKFTPHGSIKIGIDLDPIKPIPGVKTFKEDITTPSCYQKLKAELKNQKVDVVLNDGAPNVGSNWNKDAYVQIDLCLSALKLACNFLKRGGYFITKVFRSTDYNALLWVMNKFFGKVEANKPLASRFTSAEIFVVCSDFLAPDIIDEKLFDSKYVFQDTEADQFKNQMETEINSVDKIMEKRRKRQGYDIDMPMSMHKSLTLRQFLYVTNPYVVFVDFNEIKITKEDEELYISLVPMPQYVDEYIQDLKILGKKEILTILKWRGKLLHGLKKKEIQEKKEREKSELDFEKGLEEGAEGEEKEESGEEELDQQIREAQKKELKQIRKEREKKLQTVGKKSYGMEFGGQLDDEELFDLERHKKLKKMAFIDLEEEEKPRFDNKMSYKNTKELEDNLELVYEQQQERKARKNVKLEIKDNKIQAKINLNKLRAGDIDEEEYEKLKQEQIERMEILEYEGSKAIEGSKWFEKGLFKDMEKYEQAKKEDNASEAKQFQNPLKNNTSEKNDKNLKITPKTNKNKNLYDEEADSSDMYDDDDEEEENLNQSYDQDDSAIVDEDFYIPSNKKNKNKKNQEIEEDEDDFYVGDEMIKERGKRDYITQDENIDPDEKVPGELSDDEAYKLQVPKSEMQLRREKLKRQREKKGGIIEKEKVIKSDGFEVVPQIRMEDYNIDELAETLAIAKKMQRKRNREKIIDQSYNRFSSFGDEENLPRWFVEDEKLHNYKIDPITKAEFEEEKERLKAINTRAPKKILEAKIRNYKRLQKKLKKAKQKANTIMEQEGMSEGMKIKQIKSLYKKETASAKQKKRVVVGKKNASGPVKQGSKKVKYVDKRTKKDTRGEKAKEKNPERMKKRISKKRQVKRH